jgi:hypothetical protein
MQQGGMAAPFETPVTLFQKLVKADFGDTVVAAQIGPKALLLPFLKHV